MKLRITLMHSICTDEPPQSTLASRSRPSTGLKKLLAHEGIVEKLTLRDGRSRYERASAEHNDYLIDLKTGEVVAFRSKEIEKLQTEIARSLGFRVVSHRLELYGEPIEREAT